MKRCSRCATYKTKEQFTISVYQKDGLNHWCKNCTREQGRITYQKNREKVIKRTGEYRRSKKGTEIQKYAVEKWIKTNPKKHIAHRVVEMARRLGVIKITPCEVCGEKTELQAHHKDYNKPFDVNWLCPEHHKKAHNNE